MADELDFDELHQQVNKLMNDGGKPRVERAPAKPLAVKAAPIAALSQSVPSAQAPQAKDKEDTAVSVPVTVRRVMPVIAQPRKRGSAMDVVPRSRPVAVTPPSALPKHVAPALRPARPIAPQTLQPPIAPQRSMASAPSMGGGDEPSDAVLASLAIKGEGNASPDALHSVWPDPIDVHNRTKAAAVQHDAIPEKALPAPHDALIEAHEPAINPQPGSGGFEPTPQTPSEQPPTLSDGNENASPFIDTKVEKRPLGAYADPADKPEQPVGSSQRADLPRQPEELSPAVVAVENAEPEHRDEYMPTNLRAMAIPPQYHTRDRQPDDKDRPVFDTKEYHTPLAPGMAVPRKGSGGKTFAMIILILLLLVAGAVAYLWMTGMLDLSKVL